MLRSKCIKAPIDSVRDGYRVSVMTRHTKNDGITPDPDITVDRYDERCRALAPDEKVLGSYLRGEIPFERFAETYRGKLARDSESNAAMRCLIGAARTGTVTVLCVEESPEHCHRRILLEACKESAPDIVIDIR